MQVSLVLSSGGARGLAHIGAIQCLQERGYEIRYISGSSIGALVGGIHAAGRLDDYAMWVKALRRKDIVQLLDFGWGRGGGLFKGERIMDVLRELVGEHAIEDLAIGFTAVATELGRKRETWFNKGPLFSAIRASIAIPLLFAPVKVGNQVYVDGAVLNPLPIAPTLNNETDLIVAVDVNGMDEVSIPMREPKSPFQESQTDSAPEKNHDEGLAKSISSFIENIWPKNEVGSEEHGMLEIALEAMDAMQVSIARQQLSVYSPDLIVQIPRNVAQFFEFERAEELIDIGRERMDASLSALASVPPGFSTS